MDFNSSNRGWFSCPDCKQADGRPKRSYPNKSTAKRTMRLHHGDKGMRVYECPKRPGTYHLGHLPTAIRKGYWSRQEVFRG